MERKEAIDVIKKNWPDSSFTMLREALETLIPELKESEDEKIRNFICNELACLRATDGKGSDRYEELTKAINWLEKQGEPIDINPSEFDLHLNKLLKQFETLSKEELASSLSFYLNVVQNDGTYKAEEKQGEQKPADKVEPKFKVGDYIERKDGLGCHAKIFHVGGNVYGCEKLIYPEDSSPFFDLMFKNQDEFKISSDFQQKPINKVEPKFKVGDKVIGIISGMQYYITKVCDNHYCTESGCIIMFDAQDNFELVEQQLKKIEQKSTDKVEPKFKVGDWVITPNNATKQIKRVTFGNYRFTDETFYNIIDTDNKGHLWTINDAKDGDVLQLGVVTAIFQKYIGNGNCKCYCSVCDGIFEIPSQDDDDYYGCHDAIPAAKEQRELLFKSMKNDGYEWDAESKELKKIEQKPIWNNRDENYMKSAIEMIMHCIWNSYRGLYKEDVVEWLKSFKYRFAENKEEFEE